MIKVINTSNAASIPVDNLNTGQTILVGTAVQVQSDWDETDISQKDFIKNKPTVVEKVNNVSPTDGNVDTPPIPTKVSTFENDADYIPSSNVVTNQEIYDIVNI